MQTITNKSKGRKTKLRICEAIMAKNHSRTPHKIRNQIKRQTPLIHIPLAFLGIEFDFDCRSLNQRPADVNLIVTTIK